MDKPRMRVLSLCTGIGGIDLAAEATGHMEIVGQVELDDFCTSVLAYRWPHVKRMRDLKEVVGDEFGTIHLIVAGFPCQPASHAGKRRGASDDRWLWPDVYRVIQSARPAWVLLENVAGLITLGLDDVLSDLDSAGYEAAACVYPASAVGAPHQRERIFIVAHTNRANRQTGNFPASQSVARQDCRATATHDVADTYQHSGRRTQRADYRDVDGATGPHSCREGHTQRATTECGRADVVYASGTGQQERYLACIAGSTGHATGRCHTDGRGGQSQSGVGLAAHGLPGRLAGHPGWPARPGEAQYAFEAPRTVPASDKTPQRAAKLKALGNAVVPAQVYPVLAAIADTWIMEHE